MRVRNPSAGLAGSAAQVPAANTNELLSFFEESRVILGLKKEEFSRFLGVPKEIYSKILRADKDPPIQILSNFCRSFDLSVESVHRGRVDLDVLSKRVKGVRGTLPKIYNVGAFSNRRDGALFFDWMERYLGLYAREEVMRHFQVDSKTFSKSDELISIRFLEDATAYTARRFGVRVEEFQTVGQLSFEQIRDTEQGLAASSRKNVADVYEFFAKDLQLYSERNFDYKLMRLGKGRCSMHVSARTEVLEALKTERIGNLYTCSWKKGFFSVIPFYIGKREATVKKTRCVHAGDSYCRFEMDY